MACAVEFSVQQSIKIINANFSDPKIAALMASDQSPTTYSKPLSLLLANTIGQYLNTIHEYLMVTFWECAVGFFNTVQQITYAKAICFMILFAAIYLFIFIRFFSVLNKEIWQTHGIVNMIPISVLENNIRVREQVCSRTGLK
jgi:hypothetical protein